MYYYVSVPSTHISHSIDHHITKTGLMVIEVRFTQHDAGMLLLFINCDDEDVHACSLSPFHILLITISSSPMMMMMMMIDDDDAADDDDSMMMMMIK